ncbi:unnamed protein product [Chondrus crispus]|uniref:Uncharacterized protein n=1 Tax=Chondrus crispus TaxID=2769 RepID=R7QIN4_CHOCR|nr:unnamed protein product [Chondrus crispus]CDF37280.1 unnamed protein product [Chondrus crispus]|eukprot:XP_005717099.1 unnamed protein product [Chondrus crispus]
MLVIGVCRRGWGLRWAYRERYTQSNVGWCLVQGRCGESGSRWMGRTLD